MRGRALGAAALLAAALAPREASAQILDRIREKAEKAAEVVTEAQETADRYGAAVIPVSTEQEIEIGRGVAATVAGHYRVLRDPGLTRYVNLVGSAVASVDPRPGIAYRFAVLDTDEVNAFAAPGGYVFVTRGAIALMEDEAELAGVLAHEVGHVDARDVIEEIQDRARTEIGVEEISDRVDLAGEAYLRKAVETGAQALFMGLSREDELEADAFGVRRAAGAGYDPAGLERFVAALAERSGDASVSFLEKTHPDPDDRLERIDAELAGLTGAADVRAEARFRARAGGGDPGAR